MRRSTHAHRPYALGTYLDRAVVCAVVRPCRFLVRSKKEATRSISTPPLRALPHFHMAPIHVVVFDGPLGANAQRELISRGASRLDAFSGYPVRMSLPSDAPDGTTGTRGMRSPRSSRTRGNSSQLSSRPRQIGTELSRDVLNPARVPL